MNAQAAPGKTDQHAATIKLHAFLAKQNTASRRHSETMIAEGRVKVNHQPAHIGQRINPERDVIEVDGKLITTQKQTLRYFLAYKPRKVITTTSDELGRKNILSIIPSTSERLFPVGRLDADSEGLVLITNDGELAQKLTHPSFGVHKVYAVTPDRPLSELALEHLRRGVKLTDGYAKPAAVEQVADSTTGELLITMTEGRTHEIRRMLRRVGYQVDRLIRVQIGEMHADELEGKQWKELTAAEVQRMLVIPTPADSQA